MDWGLYVCLTFDIFSVTGYSSTWAYNNVIRASTFDARQMVKARPKGLFSYRVAQ